LLYLYNVGTLKITDDNRHDYQTQNYEKYLPLPPSTLGHPHQNRVVYVETRINQPPT